MKDVLFIEVDSTIVLCAQHIINTHENKTFFNKNGFQRHNDSDYIYKLNKNTTFTELRLLVTCTTKHLNISDINDTLLHIVLLNLNTPQNHKIDAKIENLNLKIPLFPHQKEALQFFEHQPRFLYKAGLGTGKTSTGIATILLTESPSRSLIVCPPILRSNWLKECVKFSFDLKPEIIFKKKDAQDILSKHKHVIISNALLKNILPLLLNYKWDNIVFDEAHSVKRQESKRTKATQKLCKQSKKVIFLTGDGMYNPKEVFSLLHILHPSIFTEFYYYSNPKGNIIPKETCKKFLFAERYMFPEIKYFGNGIKKYHFKKSRRLQELNCLLKFCVLTHKQEDVIDLPPLIRENVSIGSCSQAKKNYFQQQFLKTSLMENKREAEICVNKLVLETLKLKQKLVWDYIVCAMERYNKKIIIFVYHKEFTQFLTDNLTQMKKKFILINGDIENKKRDNILYQFEHDNEIQIGVLSLATCGTGLNLIFVQYCIVAELIFQTDYHTQSEGRSHRFGQTEKVTMEYLTLDYSSDQMMWQLLNAKINVASKMFG